MYSKTPQNRTITMDGIHANLVEVYLLT